MSDQVRRRRGPQDENFTGPGDDAEAAPDAPIMSAVCRMLLSVAGIAVVALLARRAAQWQSGDEVVFTREQLRRAAGQDGQGPLYLAILGEVFDVTSKWDAYGPGKGYHHFVGTDGSRAFLTGDFKGDLTDDVSDFDPKQCLGLVDWRDFYHKTYAYVGKLAGAFYDESGEPSQRLAWVEEQAEAGRKLKAAEEQQRLNYPECNMQYSDTEGGFVWCDDDMYPRKLYVEMQGGQPMYRCACFAELGWSDLRQIYPDCGPEDKRCKVAPAQHELDQAAAVESS